jgi:uncharacterized membrane protein
VIDFAGLNLPALGEYEIDSVSPATLGRLKTLTTVVYALQAASFFVGITAVIGVVINYVKREEVAGTWLESHFRWQIRTFWWGLLWVVIGTVLLLVLVGYVVLVVAAIWIVYRIVKGWLNLSDSKPMP